MTRTDRQDAVDGGGHPLRILHVLTRMLRAGAEENTIATCRYQVEHGHEVHLLYGRDHDVDYVAELDATIHCVHVPELVHPIHPLADFRALGALRRLYREISPDLIHTHQSKAGVLGRLAADPQIHGIVHTVHIAHFLNVGQVRERLYVALERRCARVTHQIVSVSAGVMQACLERHIGRPDQHSVVHSGMDLERFENAVAPSDLLPEQPDAARTFVVLMLAAFEPRKRQERFIEAMAPVLRRHSDMRLVFGGQGARLEPSRELAIRLGIDEQVRFLGYVTDAEAYIARADLCALTSEREGLPRVLVQYAAARKPIVVNHLPGIEEIVRDGGNGSVRSDDDIEGVALEIERLFLDRGALGVMSEAAETIDVSSWNVSRMGERLQEIYASALTAVGRSSI